MITLELSFEERPVLSSSWRIPFFLRASQSCPPYEQADSDVPEAAALDEGGHVEKRGGWQPHPQFVQAHILLFKIKGFISYVPLSLLTSHRERVNCALEVSTNTNSSIWLSNRHIGHGPPHCESPWFVSFLGLVFQG